MRGAVFNWELRCLNTCVILRNQFPLCKMGDKSKLLNNNEIYRP